MDRLWSTGESSLHELDTIRETMPPVWIIVYCLAGSAAISVLSNSFALTEGHAAILFTEMFPVVSERSGDFRAFYMIIERNFAEDASYGMPNAFFDTIFFKPVLKIDDIAPAWIRLIRQVMETDADYRDEIVSPLLRGFFYDYYSRWETVYGKNILNEGHTNADIICSKFYNLVADNFREHHDTAYYADRLNITPNYLAMLIRQICMETPKEAIGRQLILEIKYLLRTTPLTVEQISHRLHFNTASYMCRFFRKHTGTSLSEFRKLKK